MKMIVASSLNIYLIKYNFQKGYHHVKIAAIVSFYFSSILAVFLNPLKNEQANDSIKLDSASVGASILVFVRFNVSLIFYYYNQVCIHTENSGVQTLWAPKKYTKNEEQKMLIVV